MDFDDPGEIQRVYHYARRRAAHTLGSLYDEVDPAIDEDDIAQDAVHRLSGQISGSVESPVKWVSQVAHFAALKKQRIGFHHENRQAAEELDLLIEDYIIKNEQMPTERQRARWAEEIVARMRDEHPKHPSQDTFDQLRRMKFFDDDEVREELDDIEAAPSNHGPIENTSLYTALDERVRQEIDYLVDDGLASEGLPQVTELVLTYLARGYDLEHMGRRVLTPKHISELLNSRQRVWRQVLERAKTIVREATAELTAS